MTYQSRFVVALAALAYCVFASASLVRHWAGTPTPAMNWLLISPAVACVLAALSLRLGAASCVALAKQDPDISLPPTLPQLMYYFAFALLSWRSIWMFFSWDGMYIFPAWLLLASTLIPTHPRHIPCA